MSPFLALSYSLFYVNRALNILRNLDGVACCTLRILSPATPDVKAVWLRDVAANTSHTLHHAQLLVMVLDTHFPQVYLIRLRLVLFQNHEFLQELYLSKVTLISTECEL